MNILIIGGTIFLGRHITAAALERGHTVTLFNRGKHNPDLFPDVEKIQGDRTADLSPLGNRTWDAVIDTCGYLPRIVGMSAEFLKEKVAHYAFISTVSVYGEMEQPGITEESPVGRLDDESTEQITGLTYGPLKVLCEKQVEKSYPGRNLVIRPGLIVGPHDPTHRFSYWPKRIGEGGDVLAPGNPAQLVQFIDARDLATWTVMMIELQQTGVFNATGPTEKLSMKKFLEECKSATGSDARLVWADDDFLLANGVQPFTELPLWVPAGSANIHRIDNSKASGHGLNFRPVAETIRDTYEWYGGLTQDAGFPDPTLKRTRERELLMKLKG